MKHEYTSANNSHEPAAPTAPLEERGSVLIIALFLIFAAAVLGSVLAMVSSVDLKISGNQRVSTEALYIAEAGLNEATHRLSLPSPTVATVGGWTGDVAITDTAPYDPNWTARIYMTAPGSAPAAGASEFHTGTLQDLNGSYLKFSAASGTENVLTVRHKWRDLNGNSVREAGEIVRYDSGQIPAENFATGFPIEVVTVTGNAAGGTRTIESEVTRLSLAPRTLGALYIDKAIKVQGTPAFCGYDHMITIPDDTDPNACFAFHQASGHKPGISTTGDEVTTQGNAWEIIGQPTPIDTSSTNQFYTLSQTLGISNGELQMLLANADYTSIPNGTMDGITYIQGNAMANSNLDGTGLLYVKGNLTVNGNLSYKGLIYVEGDINVTGNPWVLGAVVCRGTSDWQVSAGNATILYSSEALRNYLASFFPMIQLSWREL